MTALNLNLRKVLVAVAAIMLMPLVCQGSTVYTYQRDNGSFLITDRPVHREGYRLIRQKHFGANRQTPKFNPKSQIRSRYDSLIRKTSSLISMDWALVKAVIHAESAFDPDAVSPKGATGLMQLMPATARQYGVTDLTNPAQNISAGSVHLKKLLRRYNDTRLALAAYNAGEAAVSRYNGIPPYRETMGYVDKVLGLYRLYSNGK